MASSHLNKGGEDLILKCFAYKVYPRQYGIVHHSSGVMN